MPLGYQVDPERRLVSITGEYATATEWLGLSAQLLMDRRIRPGFNFLRDLRGATRPPSATMVVAIFRVVQRFWPNLAPARGAIVVDGPTESAAVLVAQALADDYGLPIEVFTSIDVALEWLDGATPREWTT